MVSKNSEQTTGAEQARVDQSNPSMAAPAPSGPTQAVIIRYEDGVRRDETYEVESAAKAREVHPDAKIVSYADNRPYPANDESYDGGQDPATAVSPPTSAPAMHEQVVDGKRSLKSEAAAEMTAAQQVTAANQAKSQAESNKNATSDADQGGATMPASEAQ